MSINYYKQGGEIYENARNSKIRGHTDFVAEKYVGMDTYWDTPIVSAARISMTGPRWANHYYDAHDGMHTTEVGRMSKPAVGEQGTLFSRRPGVITDAFSAKNMRHTVPTLLGLAANEHAKQWMDTGSPLPMPSNSLSEHSSSIVRNLIDRGVDFPRHPDNPEGRRTNHITWDDGDSLQETDSVTVDVSPWPGPWKELSAADVQVGKDTVRSVLQRRPRR